MPYIYSEGQRRYLKRKYAAEKELDRCCDCSGCDTCSGFVTNCKCDQQRLSYFTKREENNDTETDKE